MMDLQYDVESLVAATRAVVTANGLASCYVRPIAYRGAGELGLNPSTSPIDISVVAWRWETYFGLEAQEQGVRMTISSWRRHDPNIIPPDAKISGGYVNSCLGTQEALRAGYDEAVMLNPAGYVAEGTGENLFLVRGDTILTPALSEGALPGLTRDTVIQLARDRGTPVFETRLTRTDLYTADEIFITGTAVEVTPVREVDGRTIGPRGAMTRDLQEAFSAVVRGRDDRYIRWLDRL
jgi:branched-chain amino acid aminotransferase